MKRLLHNRLVVTGAGILVFLMVLVMLGPIVVSSDPFEMNPLHRLEPPNSAYPLGTDYLGRCLLSRLLVAGRISLGTSVWVSVVILFSGLVVGLAAGLAGGRIEEIIMRMVDIFLALPSLVLTLAVIGVLGPSLDSAITGICISWWPVYARLVRGLTLTAMAKPWMQAARISGTRGMRLIIRYILPQLAPPLLVLASLEMGTMILVFSGLSFLGLGVQAPTPEWGAMLNDARHFMQTTPHMMLAPGLAIFLSVLGFNLLGEGLRDVLNVREMTEF